MFNIAGVCALCIYRSVEHVFENRCRIIGCDQAGAELVQSGQEAQLNHRVVLQGGWVRIYLRRSCAHVLSACLVPPRSHVSLRAFWKCYGLYDATASATSEALPNTARSAPDCHTWGAINYGPNK